MIGGGIGINPAGALLPRPGIVLITFELLGNFTDKQSLTGTFTATGELLGNFTTKVSLQGTIA